MKELGLTDDDNIDSKDDSISVLSEEDITHLEWLAHLSLDKESKKKQVLIKDVQKVLRCARTLQECNLSNDLDSMDKKLESGASAPLRKDEVKDINLVEDLFQLPKNHKFNMYIAPKVVDI